MDTPDAGPALADFAAGYPFALDDYQRVACAQVEAGAGVLVAAPTGAGKTVVGEFAAFMALRQGRKCFYTTPIKALSNQKYHDLVARHGADSVGLLTGDTSINSEARVVVMTTEVLRNMIYANSRTLRGLGYVVMDEVHYLADRFRGAVWEEVIIGLSESVQLVSLSATVSNAEEFGAWLGEVRGNTAVVVSERRPVPLFQHVMAGRRLYDLFDAGGEGVNPELTRLAKEESRGVRDDARRPRGRDGRGRRTVSYGSGSYGGAHARPDRDERPRLAPRRTTVIERLDAEALLPAIYFIFSRAGCDGAVKQAMGSRLRLTTPQQRRELDEIAERHAQGLGAADRDAVGFAEFADALRAGIAAHHAGLLPAFKECVEEAFVRGLVKVVFATETLALGINMPARSVVLEKLVKYNGESHADITPGEYTQLTGRAGRRGIDVEGHAVVLWASGMDPRMVAGLASRRTYPLRSSFAPTYNMAVNLVGSVGRDRARVLLEQSFAQYQSDASVVGLARTIARNTDAIAAHLRQAHCERADFGQYARLRAEISRLEGEAARIRRADRRAESVQVLSQLLPGDLIGVPAGRQAGWAVVLEPGSQADREGPRPLVLTVDRQVKRLGTIDFPTPPRVVGRMRVPKHFNPREPASRRNLAAALRAKLEGLDLAAAPYRQAEMDAEVVARIADVRAQLRMHPCHDCPDRENHARWAEQALRLERENEQLKAQVERRTNTIAVKFDRICGVLEALGYLSAGAADAPFDGLKEPVSGASAPEPSSAPELVEATEGVGPGEPTSNPERVVGSEDDRAGELVVTESGRTLARIYGELDLVTAQSVRLGVFEGLNAPQLAAVLSSLVYESRGDTVRPPRMPDGVSESAQSALRRVWREVSLLERDHRLSSAEAPNIGFAEAAFAWASGRPLATVLGQSGMTAGDFVRWTRQVIDLSGQLAVAVGPGRLQDVCREVVDRMRRGVVDARD